ncbi:hypothetical protein TSMEX_009738 [Taenia solium]|eukprot:TsM_000744200 transcript=TsM_000744200 gene=TsM_000744200
MVLIDAGAVAPCQTTRRRRSILAAYEEAANGKGYYFCLTMRQAAFNLNPSDGSFAPLAGRPGTYTRGSSRTELDYHSNDQLWVNNPTLGEICFTMIGRADIEGSKSGVAINAQSPQASYLCSHAFIVRIRAENQNQVSFCPSTPCQVSVLAELTLRHLRYDLTDVLP